MTPRKSHEEGRDASAENNHALKLWAWVVLQALIPAVVVLGTWLVSDFLFNVHFAFQKAFVGAELVLVGSILLMTLLIDIYIEQRQTNARKGMVSLDRLWIVSAFLTFVAIFCFACLKIKALGYDFPPNGPVDPSINICIRINIVFGLVAIIWGTAVAVFAQRKFLEAELSKTNER